MKYWVLLLLTCNQTVYDAIYRQMVLRALTSTDSLRTVMYERNRDIEMLRALCRGQLSSYERPLPKQLN